MDKKFCDKCKKEIKGEYYYIETCKKQEDGDNEDDKYQEGLEYCPECYKKIKF